MPNKAEFAVCTIAMEGKSRRGRQRSKDEIVRADHS